MYVAAVDEKYRDRVRKQAYMHVQIDRDTYPGAVLGKAFEKDGTRTDLTVLAEVVDYNSTTQTYENSTGPVSIAAEFLSSAEGVVKLNARLIRVDVPTNDPFFHYEYQEQPQRIAAAAAGRGERRAALADRLVPLARVPVRPGQGVQAVQGDGGVWPRPRRPQHVLRVPGPRPL